MPEILYSISVHADMHSKNVFVIFDADKFVVFIYVHIRCDIEKGDDNFWHILKSILQIFVL